MNSLLITEQLKLVLLTGLREELILIVSTFELSLAFEIFKYPDDDDEIMYIVSLIKTYWEEREIGEESILNKKLTFIYIK